MEVLSVGLLASLFESFLDSPNILTSVLILFIIIIIEVSDFVF